MDLVTMLYTTYQLIKLENIRLGKSYVLKHVTGCNCSWEIKGFVGSTAPSCAHKKTGLELFLYIVD